MKKYTLTKEEMLRRPLTHSVLELLKEKGAPILGDIYLRPDPDYDYTIYPNPLGGMDYTFTKREIIGQSEGIHRDISG